MTEPQKKFHLNTKRPSKEQMAAIAKATLAPGSGYVALPKPGQKMPDGTVYLGQYTPKDRDGKSLSKTFNVFAAPEDLPNTMTYVGAVKHIAELKNWHGHNGTIYPSDKEIYAALKDDSYKGGWIIPTRDILHGKDVDDEETMSDNIRTHKDKGAFKGTFKAAAGMEGSGFPGWYWSSTEDRDDSSFVWDVRLAGDGAGWSLKNDSRASCRPVRLVEIQKP